MSTWGDSWGTSWGSSWDIGTSPTPTPVVARHPVWGMRIQPDKESFIMDDMEAAALGVALLMLGDNR